MGEPVPFVDDWDRIVTSIKYDLGPEMIHVDPVLAVYWTDLPH